MRTQNPDGRLVFTETEGERAFRPDAKLVPRDTVLAIIQREDTDEFLCLPWKKVPIRAFVTGGIEQGENIFDAACREVSTETGYQSILPLYEICPAFIDRFFQPIKEENREATVFPIFCRITSDHYVTPAQSESELHKPKWLKRPKVAQFLNIESHRYVWEKFCSNQPA